MVSFLTHLSSWPKGERGSCVSGKMTWAFISTDTATGLQILRGSWDQINVAEGEVAEVCGAWACITFHLIMVCIGSSGPISSAKEIRMKMLWAGPSGSPQLVSWGAGGTLNRQPCVRPCIIFCPISSLCALFRFLGILCLLSCCRNPNSPDWKLKSYLQSYCQDKRLVQFSFPYNQPFCTPLSIEWEKSDFFTGSLILCFRTLWPALKFGI